MLKFLVSMVKKVFSVGYPFPGDVVDTLSLKSTQSLLDADIILFMPTFSDYSNSYQAYNGKPKITESDSQRLIEDLKRWRYELKVAFEHGKTIFIFLAKFEEVYVYTGKNEVSGTGRNQKTINYVDLVNNYSFLPINLGKIISSSGSEIKISKELGVLSTYWDQFGAYSSYEVYLENSELKPLLTTKVGNKLVGTLIKKEEGTLILLPPINNTEKLTRINAYGEDVWTKKGREFGAKVEYIILGIDKALNYRQSLTPAPKWTCENTYKLATEYKITSDIEQILKEISLLEEKKKLLEIDLKEESLLRNLLFETGKPLEKAIIKALKIMGFDAEGYQDSDSEFDAIFSSKEGRFLGEAEGKDNKPINIEKLSQLERNIHEDFEREGVEDYAKGVLFGNAYRFTEIEKRSEYFTQKCSTGAIRAKVALVRTPDLFFVAKYLRENDDQMYAELCRKAIFEAEGKIVDFPELS
ncbi:hypothetical protein EO98_19275 [Methanosarcina sp. 2.H.T.1A.6]|nr:hypothetical protein EO94_09885 [Methanosarcina sp. 2.H.T.1A.3]KKG19084.1 hypothetical protein EO97_03970 [Methanosarcina sp. 2.H.T.1A.15]KKG19400.1 hypothetical protein EO98_19275 [Methanosarcina sp. 2.H.T.1A.6]KKG25559.1 hypothetical protein EO96_18570 [Methanosarcina sp. 2.H.T.1A.8]